MASKKLRWLSLILLFYVILLIPSYYLMYSASSLYGSHPTHKTILLTTPLYALLILVLFMVPVLAVGLVVWILKKNKRSQDVTDR